MCYTRISAATFTTDWQKLSVSFRGRLQPKVSRFGGGTEIDTAITTRRRFSGQRVIAYLNLRGGGMEPIFEEGVSRISNLLFGPTKRINIRESNHDRRAIDPSIVRLISNHRDR